MLNSGGKRSISVLLTHLDPLQRTDTIATLVVTKGTRTYFNWCSNLCTLIIWLLWWTSIIWSIMHWWTSIIWSVMHWWTSIIWSVKYTDGPALSGALLSSSCDSAPLISSARTFSPVSCRHFTNFSQVTGNLPFPSNHCRRISTVIATELPCFVSC